MIRYIDPAYEPDEAAFIRLCFRELCRKGGAAGCRAACLFAAYSRYEAAARFWVGIGENKTPECAIALCDGCAAVCVSEAAEQTELKEFLLISGAETVFCEFPLFPDSALKQSGIIMKPGKNRLHKKDYSDVCIYSGFEELCADDVFSLLRLCECEDIILPDKTGFQLQLSLLQKLGSPYCSLIKKDGRIISFAMTVSQTENAAIAGAVCTHPEYRRQGYGKKCVGALLGALQGKEIYLMRSPDRNEHFYSSLGFENCGSFYIYGTK